MMGSFHGVSQHFPKKQQPRLLDVVQLSLALPALRYTDTIQFREQLKTGLKHYSTTINAIFLGAQAATPGMAFLSGYQNAIRCLDTYCPHDVLAAFCVSEKGIKRPWDMLSKLTASNQGYSLSGQKGFVMLLPDNLDRLYVIAKDEGEQLKCVYLDRHSDGLDITQPLKAPFIQDIPHSGVSFKQISIAKHQVMQGDGHRNANKPFRYWEDIHVLLAMLSWMIRERVSDGASVAELSQLFTLMSQIIECFDAQPSYYSPEVFTLLDQAQVLLDDAAQMLPTQRLAMWQKDRALLQMGQKIRQLIQAKLNV